MNSKTQTILVAITIYAIAILVAYIARRLLASFLKINTRKLNVDPTKYNFLRNASSFIIFLIATMAVFYFTPSLRALGKTLFAGAGIFAAIIGFASQQAFSNIIGGIFIVIFKPFRVGDLIEVGGNYKGTIEDITLRHTVIKDFESKRVVIPNSVISSETILNSSLKDGKINRRIEFRLALDADIDRAIDIISETITAHSNFIDGRTEEDLENGVPLITVRTTSIGEYFVNLMTYALAENSGKAFVMHCDVNKEILYRFKQEKIELAVPYRVVVQKEMN